MSKSDLLYSTVDDLKASYGDGSLSPVAVTQACLARIAEQDRALGAFVLVDEERALKDAEASAARWQAGQALSPIDGIPVAVKDLFATKGWPTLKGCALVSPEGPWEDDAPTIAHLKAAGAILMGKTATCDHGCKPTTDNPITGQVTRNPWNPDLTPGGSSGGAAAALASGMVPLALGSDGGGSIRIPASFCGVFGLKPTFGLVPIWPYGAFDTLGHAGPMTRTVKDAAYLLNVLAKPDPRDWRASPDLERDYTNGIETGVEGLRVAYSARLRHATVDPEVAGLVEAAVHRFEELGAQVEPIDPYEEDPFDLYLTLAWGGAASAFDGLPDSILENLDPVLATAVEAGRKLSLIDCSRAHRARTDFATRLSLFTADYDLILSPVVSVAAFPIWQDDPKDWPSGKSGPGGERQSFTWAPLALPYNLSQQPAASVPCGFTSTGLPVGLQIAAARYRDDLVLRAAYAYEQAHPVHKRKADGLIRAAQAQQQQ